MPRPIVSFSCLATGSRDRPRWVRGVLLTWSVLEAGGGFHVNATHLTSAGQPAAGWFLGGTPLGYYAERSVVCADSSGGMWVAYESDPQVAHVSSSTSMAFYDACSETSPKGTPGIVSDGAGGAILFWLDYRVAQVTQLYAQHILSDGGYATGWPAEGLPISSAMSAAGGTRYGGKHIALPTQSVVSDGSGGAYVAWTDYRANPTEGDVYSQHVLGDGTFPPGWPTNGLAICTAAGNQNRPTVAGDGSGDFS